MKLPNKRSGDTADQLVLVAMLTSWILIALPAHALEGAAFDRVIHVSVDGLHHRAIEALERAQEPIPSFALLRKEGAYTDNARTDPILANTLPNNASMLTGRPVFGRWGHGWFINDDTESTPQLTVHALRGEYVASVFDVAHTHGLSTTLYASKGKFGVFNRSWNDDGGGSPKINYVNLARLSPPPDGKDPDEYFVEEFIEDILANDSKYAYLHLREPDATGHDYDWDLSTSPLSRYLEAVVEVDGLLGLLIEAAKAMSRNGETVALIVTSDHGGILGTGEHYILRIAGAVESGIVPFYVWSPSDTIVQGDLYDLNFWRLDPGTWLPFRLFWFPPIRNSDSANLALDLLGLPAVPDSVINHRQDLWVGQ